MSISTVSHATPSVNPQPVAPKAQPATTPKPATTQPVSHATDADGDHDGSVGGTIDVKA